MAEIGEGGSCGNPGTDDNRGDRICATNEQFAVGGRLLKLWKIRGKTFVWGRAVSTRGDFVFGRRKKKPLIPIGTTLRRRKEEEK